LRRGAVVSVPENAVFSAEQGGYRYEPNLEIVGYIAIRARADRVFRGKRNSSMVPYGKTSAGYFLVTSVKTKLE